MVDKKLGTPKVHVRRFRARLGGQRARINGSNARHIELKILRVTSSRHKCCKISLTCNSHQGPGEAATMPTKRRASSESLESSASSPVTKKMRADSMSLETVLGLSRNALTGLPVDTLVSHILELQRAYKDVALQLANSKNEPKNAIQSKVIAAATPAMSADQVQVKADKMAKMMAAEIKKQMKWQYVDIVPVLLACESLADNG